MSQPIKAVRILKNKIAFGRYHNSAHEGYMYVWVNGKEIIRISYDYALMDNSTQFSLAGYLAESFGYDGEAMPEVIDDKLLQMHRELYEAQFL